VVFFNAYQNLTGRDC